MLVWRSDGVAGATTGWLNLSDKLMWLTDVFRERWKGFDRASAALITVVIVAGVVLHRRIGFASELGWVTLALLGAFLVVPYTLLGSGLPDMRLVPLVFAAAVVALGTPRNRCWASSVAAAALLFFLARTAVVTFEFVEYARGYRQQLVALNYIPKGARILVVAAWPCHNEWGDGRMEHLGGLAIVRRDAFTNDQWALSGAQLLSIHNEAAGAFQQDPSQFIPPSLCKGLREPIVAGAIPNFPTLAFDYVWLIDLPQADHIQRPDLIRVWSRSNGALYRVMHAIPA